MGETLGKIHPEEKLLSRCEPMKPGKLCASKTQCWNVHRIDITIPKGTHQKEERGEGFQASPESSKANFISS